MSSVLNFTQPTSKINDEKSVLKHGKAADIFPFQPKNANPKGFGSVMHLMAVCGKILHSIQYVTAALRGKVYPNRALVVFSIQGSLSSLSPVVSGRFQLIFPQKSE